MQVTLTQIYRDQKVGQKGPYTSVRIKTVEYGDQYLSGYGNAGNQNWKAGDKVEINVTNKEVNGKTYLNFENPKPDNTSNALAVMSEIKALRADMNRAFQALNDKLDMIRGVSGDPAAIDAAMKAGGPVDSNGNRIVNVDDAIESPYDNPPDSAFDDGEWRS